VDSVIEQIVLSVVLEKFEDTKGGNQNLQGKTNTVCGQKGMGTKRQTIIHIIMCRKLKIRQHETH
jgi:hypothetical protein